MSAPFNNIRSKTNRAVCAYLIGKGIGGQDNIRPGNSPLAKTYPNVTARVIIGKPEVPLIGVYRVNLALHIRGSAATDPAVLDQNGHFGLVQFEKLLSNVNDAMMISADGFTLCQTAEDITTAGRLLTLPAGNTPEAIQAAQNNADMADFTMQNIYDDGFGEGDPSAVGCDWEEIILFQALVCGSNTD